MNGRGLEEGSVRIVCGSAEDPVEPGQRCRDCGAGTGDVHEDGCCIERCSQRHRSEDGFLQQAFCCTECWAEDDRTFQLMVEGWDA